ncbi:hypothetical protein L3Y34_017508 [Caenorhabditis briggsae]|uniref:Uncharacterized protein n=1 Tax=Caenorhabditis briggsae TaxID=6238 RepID=A0AAE9DHZ7_CAEBR|nr:hypothetical protein L3Y34_017508 [Caenorhabditis briggsae]
MADDGYELMGPAQGPLAPAPIGPPLAVGQKPTVAPPTAKPLPAIVNQKKAVPKRADTETDSSVEPTAKSVAEGRKGKSSVRSVMTEPAEKSRMESCYLDGNAISQRPNTLDICQLSGAIFLTLIVVSISIPVILTAVGQADIEWIKTKLAKL